MYQECWRSLPACSVYIEDIPAQHLCVSRLGECCCRQWDAVPIIAPNTQESGQTTTRGWVLRLAPTKRR